MSELIIHNIKSYSVHKLNLGNSLSRLEKISNDSNKQQLSTDASLIFSYKPIDINISCEMKYHGVVGRIYKAKQMYEEIIKNEGDIGEEEYSKYNRAVEELSAAIENASETDRARIELFVKELADGSKRVLLVVRDVEKNAPTTEFGQLKQAVKNQSKKVVLSNKTARMFQPHARSLGCEDDLDAIFGQSKEAAKILLGLNFKYKLGLEDESLTGLFVVLQTNPKDFDADPSEKASSNDGRIFNPFSHRNDIYTVSIIEDAIQKCDSAEKRARANEIAMRINDEKKEAEKQYYKILEQKG